MFHVLSLKNLICHWFSMEFLGFFSKFHIQNQVFINSSLKIWYFSCSLIEKLVVSLIFYYFDLEKRVFSLIFYWFSCLLAILTYEKQYFIVFSVNNLYFSCFLIERSFWELLGVFWELLGASGSLWELLGPPGGFVGPLRAFWRLPGTSWGPPGASGSLRSDWKIVKIINF